MFPRKLLEGKQENLMGWLNHSLDCILFSKTNDMKGKQSLWKSLTMKSEQDLNMQASDKGEVLNEYKVFFPSNKTQVQTAVECEAS